MYVYVSMYVCMYTHVSRPMRLSKSMPVSMSLSMFASMPVPMCVIMPMSMPVSMSVSMPMRKMPVPLNMLSRHVKPC